MPEQSFQWGEEGYEIAIREDLSLEDMVAMDQAGEPFMRTAHVGNLSLSNCVVLDAALRGVLLDRNCAAKDDIFHPGDIIRGGQATAIIDQSDESRSTTHVTTHEDTATLPGGVEPNQPVLDLHMRSIREAFPDTRLGTVSEYLADHAEVVATIVHDLSRAGLLEWTRYMNHEGREIKIEHHPENPQRYGLFGDGQAENSESGVIMPTNCLNLILGVADALAYDTDRVYHLGGAAMPVYMSDKRRQDEMQKMYRELRSGSLGNRLPPHLQFNIIPIEGLNFAAPDSLPDRTALDEQLATYADIAETDADQLEARRMAAIETPVDQRKLVMKGLGEAIAHNRSRLQGIVDLYPPAFPDRPAKQFISHYDIVDTGLYVPDFTRRTPLRDLAEMRARMARGTWVKK